MGKVWKSEGYAGTNLLIVYFKFLENNILAVSEDGVNFRSQDETQNVFKWKIDNEDILKIDYSFKPKVRDVPISEMYEFEQKKKLKGVRNYIIHTTPLTDSVRLSVKK